MSFTQAYWDAVAAFFVDPDIEKMINNVATLFIIYDVKKEAEWYKWP